MFRFFLTIALLPILLPTIQPVSAQSVSVLQDSAFVADAKIGIDYLYNLQPAEADSVFTMLSIRHPYHPAGPFMEGLNLWWTIMLDLSDTSHDDDFMDIMDEVIERADNRLDRNENDLDALFFKGAARGFRGRLHSNRKRWVRAAWDGKKALNTIVKVAALDPQNDDFYFGWGVYDYFADVLPRERSYLKPVMWFFPDGDRVRGLAELKRTAENGHLIQTEAVYFLAQIYYLFEKDYNESRHYVSWLREHYPNNSFFHTMEARIYIRWGRWHLGAQTFKEVMGQYYDHKYGYNEAMAIQALYYLARDRMRRRSFTEAISYLEEQKLIQDEKGNDTYFGTVGRLRLGMCYDAVGQRKAARKAYIEVLRMDDVAEVHDQARKYLEKPYK